MDRGRAVQAGPAREVVKAYLDRLSADEARRAEELKTLKKERDDRPAPRVQEMLYGPIYNEPDRIEGPEVEFLVEGRESASVRLHQGVAIKYRFKLLAPVRDLNVTLSIYREDGLHMTAISTLNGGLLDGVREGEVACEVAIRDLYLNPGRYVMVLPIHEGHSYLYRDVVKRFVVVEGDRMTWGLVDLPYDYTVRRGPEGASDGRRGES
jgi:hypothetical protein